MSWNQLVVVNRVLEIAGKAASFIWFSIVAAIILGFDPKTAVETALNSGAPVKGLLAIAILIPTVIFLLLRSALGYCRWRVQRELWRRDVRRLTRIAREAGATGLDAPTIPESNWIASSLERVGWLPRQRT